MLKLSLMRYVGKAVEFVEYLMSFHEYPRYQCPQFTDLPYFPESRIIQITAQQAHKRNQNCHQQFSSANHTPHTLHTPPLHLKMEIIKLNWQDPSAACGRNFDNHKRIPAHTLPLQTFWHSNLQSVLFCISICVFSKCRILCFEKRSHQIEIDCLLGWSLLSQISNGISKMELQEGIYGFPAQKYLLYEFKWISEKK